MRGWIRTSLVAVLLMAVGMAGVGAGEKTGAAGTTGATSATGATGAVGCTVRLKLTAEAAFDEPLSRWLSEVAGMVRLTVRSARFPDARLAVLSLTMGEVRAFDLSLSSERGVLTLDGSLLDQPARLSPLTDATGAADWAQALLGAAESVATMPSLGRQVALSGEGLARVLKLAAVRLRAWAATARATAGQACESCGACAVCKRVDVSEAAALVADALAERFDMVVDQNVLVIEVVPFELAEQPAAVRPAEPAPDDLNVRLVKDGLWAIARAIAGNDASACRSQ